MLLFIALSGSIRPYNLHRLTDSVSYGLIEGVKMSKVKKRTAVVKRKTNETNILINLNIDGSGKHKISTGIAFLDHMLSLFAKHGLFDVAIDATGDINVDIHHTNEDIGLCLGKAFKVALGDKKSIKRFGLGYVPMEDALARVVVDISDRPSLHFVETKDIKEKAVYSFKDLKHFLESFAREAGMNISVGIKSGSDMHHILEAIFKAFARALDEATQFDSRVKGIPSTKGVL